VTVFHTIYKKTSSGATQLWYAEVEGGKFRTISGQIDGKKTTSEWTVTEPKNVGKQNATTAEQQAVAEVEALYRKKLAKDYHERVDTIAAPKIFAPMLAEKYKDHKDSVKGEVFVQPKLDGIRCIAKKDGLWTRNGKAIVNCPHVSDALKPIFDRFPDAIFDGELYNHSLKDDFNEIASNVKKTKPTPETWDRARRTVQYHIYDFPSYSGTFSARRMELEDIIPTQLGHTAFLQLVETYVVMGDEIDEMYAKFIEDGYEGLMVRQQAYESSAEV
jgi:DNA ligase-1